MKPGRVGYALQRQLTTPRVSGDVVAPALIPRKRASGSQRIGAMRASWWRWGGRRC
jgi:hypothetical protein